MITLGVVLLILGVLTHIAILWSIGVLLVVVGAILWLPERLAVKSVGDATTTNALRSPVETCPSRPARRDLPVETGPIVGRF
jgi:type IV secretory pathway VirB3-like protein